MLLDLYLQDLSQKMKLLHYRNKHFDLIISKDSPLLGFEKTVLDEPESMDISRSDDNQTELKEKYDSLINEHEQCVKKMNELKMKIKHLESELEVTEHKLSISEKSSLVIFACSKCENTFESKQILETHVQSKHKNVEKIKCDKCHETFDNASELSIHKKQSHVSESKKDYSCQKCNFATNTEFELKRHIVQCTHNKSNNVDAINQITCHICSSQFNLKSELMKHRKESHSERVQKCRYYQEGVCIFDDNSCWYRHEKVDDQLKSFKCDVCDVSFNSTHNLRFHKKNKHPDFHNIQEIHPPNMMKGLMEKMEMVLQRVAALEINHKDRN